MPRIELAKLATWFEAYGRALVLYARQLSPAADRSHAEDVVQEVYVKLLAQCGSRTGLQEPPNPSAWLHRCVRNASMDHRRMRLRRERREQSLAAERLDWFEPQPGDLVDARLAQDALTSLPDLQRQVVTLRIWSGFTFAEVAEIINQPLSTVHDHYRRGLAALRTALESRNAHARTTTYGT